MAKTEFVFLSEEDMIQAGVLDSKHCVDVMVEMFQLVGRGDYVMGGPTQNAHGLKLIFPKESPFPNMPVAGPDRRFMAMPAYLGGRFNVCGCKWYGSNIANPQSGLPRSVLMIMLNNPTTGEPIALLSGNLVSAMRTGAVPGVATRFLAKKGAKVCAALGGGPVNRGSVKCIASQAPNLEEIIIYDIKEEAGKRFQKFVEDEIGLKCTIAASMEETVRAADIVVATIPSPKPVHVPDEWLKKGSLLILNNYLDLDDSYLADAKTVFDNTKMHRSYMDDCHHKACGALEAYKDYIAGKVYTAIEKGLVAPMEEQLSLGDIALDPTKGRQNDDDRIVVFTSGMAVEDISWGYTIYEQAMRKNLGVNLTLWEEPHWS